MTQEIKAVYLLQYGELALRTLIKNLTFSLQSIIRIKKPIFLEHALHFILEEDNLNYSIHTFNKPPQHTNTQRRQALFSNIPRHNNQHNNFFSIPLRPY